jgi:hypothetical protein
MLFRKKTLFTVRSIRNTQIYYVGRMQSFNMLKEVVYIVIDLPRVTIVNSQQPAVARRRAVNNNRRMVFSVESVPMDAHATIEYVMPSLSNNCTTEERCFLCSSCRSYIMS